MDMKLSVFVRIGSILYGLLQFSGLIDVLLEPEETLAYVYGGILVDIRRYVDLPVLQVWYIVFVPVLSLLLVVGGIMKNSHLIQVYLFVSYFSLLVSLPTTFSAIAYANVNSIQRARDLCWTVFWLATVHAMMKRWSRKDKRLDEDVEQILE